MYRMLQPEAAPGFGDQYAVAGIADVVPDLDGLVEAIPEDVVGKARDVLGAVVGDAGEAVAVEKDFGAGGDAVFAVEGAGVDEMAIGDAAGEGELLAAAALELFCSGAAGADEPVGGGCCDDDTGGDAADEAGVQITKFTVGKLYDLGRMRF